MGLSDSSTTTWADDGASAHYLLSASNLGADWLNFGQAFAIANEVKADLIQIDIADGHFVPTITFGEELVQRCRQVTDIPIETHLMVSRPQDWIEAVAARGADLVLMHWEASSRFQGLIDQCRRANVGAGVVLNSETRADVLKYILPYVDIVNLLAIIPGFARQAFMPEVLEKVTRTRELIESTPGCEALIEVDGGISAHNASAVLEAGADILVVSSGIYGGEDPVGRAGQLRQEMDSVAIRSGFEAKSADLMGRIETRRKLRNRQ